MWLNERVITFIEDLQSSACLWDVHCAKYKNRNKKGDAIDFLAKKYEISHIEVEKKSANLKSQFRREHKKVVASKKTGSSPKKPTWFAYKALIFLLQHNESRGSRSNLTEEGNNASIFSNSLSVRNLRDFRLPPPCVDKICALLEYYAGLSCTSAPTFQDHLWVPSSRVKKSKTY
jgi:hypothetical protein